jgi:hypothetical protein
MSASATTRVVTTSGAVVGAPTDKAISDEALASAAVDGVEIAVVEAEKAVEESKEAGTAVSSVAEAGKDAVVVDAVVVDAVVVDAVEVSLPVEVVKTSDVMEGLADASFIGVTVLVRLTRVTSESFS